MTTLPLQKKHIFGAAAIFAVGTGVVVLAGLLAPSERGAFHVVSTRPIGATTIVRAAEKNEFAEIGSECWIYSRQDVRAAIEKYLDIIGSSPDGQNQLAIYRNAGQSAPGQKSIECRSGNLVFIAKSEIEAWDKRAAHSARIRTDIEATIASIEGHK